MDGGKGSGKPQLAMPYLLQGEVLPHLPVVVEMAQFEGQSLHMVRLQGIVVIDDIVVGRTNSPPVSSLADQVEVIPAEKRGRVARRSHKTRPN